MQAVHCFDAGLVVNPSFPYLGASLDGKVYDPTEKDPFGLLEVKITYTWRNHTMEEACKNPDFCLHMVNGKPKHKENDKSSYYDQVQGQLAVTGLPWCDFVVRVTQYKCCADLLQSKALGSKPFSKV